MPKNDAICNTIKILQEDIAREFPEVFRLGMDLVKQSLGVFAYESQRGYSSPMVHGVLDGFSYILNHALTVEDNKINSIFLRELHRQFSEHSRLEKSHQGIFLGGTCSVAINCCDAEGLTELAEFNRHSQVKLFTPATELPYGNGKFYHSEVIITVLDATFLVLRNTFAYSGIANSVEEMALIHSILKYTADFFAYFDSFDYEDGPFKTLVLTNPSSGVQLQLTHNIMLTFINRMFVDIDLHSIIITLAQQANSKRPLLPKVKVNLNKDSLVNAAYARTCASLFSYTSTAEIYSKAIYEFNSLLDNMGIKVNPDVLAKSREITMDFMQSPTLGKLLSFRDMYAKEHQFYNYNYPTLMPNAGKFGVGLSNHEREDILKIIEQVIVEYNANIDSCATARDKILLIAKTVACLERIHPFYDHTIASRDSVG